MQVDGAHRVRREAACIKPFICVRRLGSISLGVARSEIGIVAGIRTMVPASGIMAVYGGLRPLTGKVTEGATPPHDAIQVPGGISLR